jgi:hypothetical protein
MTRLICATLLAMATLLTPLLAVADDRTQFASLARTGMDVFVTSVDGLERRGRIADIADEGLRLSFGGRVRLVPWDEIIIVERRGDSIVDGALKGACISFVFYGISALLYGAPVDDVLTFAGPAVLGWGMIGAAIDAFNVGRTRIYVGPAAAGMQMSRRPAFVPGRGAPPGVAVGVRIPF